MHAILLAVCFYHVLFLFQNIHTSEVQTGGEKLVYGLLVKNPHDYEYFKHFKMDNRPILQTCKELELNSYERTDHDENIAHDIFSEKGSFFTEAVTISCIIIGCICVVGVVYETFRWRMRIKKINSATANEQ